jgi:hypothetical protein
VYEKYLKSVGDHNNESWWNGFYVALLKKSENKIEWKKTDKAAYNGKVEWQKIDEAEKK